MDSVTQLVTGALLAAAVVPAKHRRAALWAGAALGTLPDLDVLPLSLLNDDPVLKMTAHRSITHSLLVLPWVAWLIWWWCKRSKGRVAEAPQAWWWAIFLALVNHPLLDCFNAYGTWLFWPLGEQAIMWGNMFVIDPLFTLPLLLGFVWVAFKPLSKHSSKVIYGAIGMSMVYFAWSLAAQMWVMQKVDKQLAELGLQDSPKFKLAMALEKIALEDPYFVERKLYPNVDFYSGIVLSALGIPVSMFTVIFALARTVGWISHWHEMIADPHQKIGRPRQLYTGEQRRDYVPVSQR